MIRYKDQQRPADHDEALRILRRLEQRRPRDIERAKDLFSTFVDPAINYMPNPTSAQVNAVNCSFTEWCFYDFVLEPDPSGAVDVNTTFTVDRSNASMRSDNRGSSDMPKTSDPTLDVLPILIAALVLIAIGGAVYVIRRKRQ